MSDKHQAKSKNKSTPFIKVIFPFLKWFDEISFNSFRNDLISGITVALVLIPQSMAYAQLAGLPAYYGLYAAFIPPTIAAMFGSSHQLATGPVAVVSLMTATALAPLASLGSEGFIAYAIMLALMVGLFQFLLGVFRLGLVVNFLSHPVVNGFTNAAAIIIATSQLSKLFGVKVDRYEHHYETIYHVIEEAIAFTHWPTLFLALLAFLLMYSLKRLNPRIPNVLVAVMVTTLISYFIGFEKNLQVSLGDIHSPEIQTVIEEYNNNYSHIDSLVERRLAVNGALKSAENNGDANPADILHLEHQSSLLTWQINMYEDEVRKYRSELRGFHLSLTNHGDTDTTFYLASHQPANLDNDGRTWRISISNKPVDPDLIFLMGGGAVVGVIPSGLPRISIPKVELGTALDLLAMAVIISLLGFMEAISIARAMAAKTGQRLDPNQELIGQGLANILGSVSQCYPVSGSFSRSAVNIQAGALTGLSSVFSSVVVMITLLFFTPLLYHLPQSVLAAIIMMAVIGLINVKGFIHAYQAQKYDGVIAIVSFVGTLAFAPHLDKGIMIGVLLSLGHYLFRRIKPDMAMLSKYVDGTFRDSDRRHLQECKYLAVVRFNNSLFFANVSYLEEKILELLSTKEDLRHVHIVCNAINELDASGEATLSLLTTRLREKEIGISLSGVNENVLEVMKRTHLIDKIGYDSIFGNVSLAVYHLHDITHRNSTEDKCPLLDAIPKEDKTLPNSEGKELVLPPKP
ncbi:sodium-independent anion transporter [candidate division LCP-89 bacterium B3_LCP]|uniref:Sodium-independent anion transporter n=1 Tax=candidate division LCP-89 bacterium B3_LCP TaxID=2012998 RepID=A0A532UYD7_UNCL8|nr:MAG: sodium-independent anion transporter [candidate division LCP-89 bacterium B3_LCP]